MWVKSRQVAERDLENRDTLIQESNNNIERRLKLLGNVYAMYVH